MRLGGLTSNYLQSSKYIPVNNEQYQRMKAAFERQGGEISRSNETDMYLDMSGAGAVTFNENLEMYKQSLAKRE